MIRAGLVTISGVEYPLVYSLRVKEQLQRRQWETNIEGKVHLLQLLMEAGKRWADEVGEACPETPSVDWLLDNIGEEEQDVFDEVERVLKPKRAVEAKTPKE